MVYAQECKEHQKCRDYLEINSIEEAEERLWWLLARLGKSYRAELQKNKGVACVWSGSLTCFFEANLSRFLPEKNYTLLKEENAFFLEYVISPQAAFTACITTNPRQWRFALANISYCS